ncbi:MAG: DUF2125 domain-containing protein [Rhodobacteraceae bacterium]|jgi:hypothetical protein|nr:DUF2125 domain-containing protein [Paracoccaceae bacterium]
MRRLIWVVIVLAVVWAGGWVAIAQVIQTRTDAWFAARVAQGWQAEYAELSVTGFPTGFLIGFRDVALADPATGVAWQSPTFRVEAAGLRRHQVSVLWPPVQTVATPLQRITVETRDMRADVGLLPGPALTLDRSDMTLDGLRLVSTLGWEAAIERGQIASRTSTTAPPDAHAHDVTLAATGYVLPAALKRVLDPAGLLPGRIEGVRADMTLGFDRPWDRRAIEMRRPQPRSIDIRSMDAEWGTLALRAAGRIEIDGDGVPAGRITVRAENWREIVGLAVNAGLVPAGLSRTLERGLGLLAALGPNPDVIEAPLSFQGGFMSLGPLPLGPAPRIVLR